MTPDTITLTLPPEREFQRVAHLVLGGLAVRLNLTLEALEDLQLALDGLLDTGSAEEPFDFCWHVRRLCADITSRTVAQRHEAGLSHIPEDRHRRGLILEYTVANNLILGVQKDFSPNGIIDRDRVMENAMEEVTSFDIRPPTPRRA